VYGKQSDGYGAARRSIRAYTSRLEFYKEFCALKKITTTEWLKNTNHLWEYVACFREQRKYAGNGTGRKRNGERFSDRYVHNIVSTLGTFALNLDIDVLCKNILKKLGYAKKEILAYPDQEFNLLWAAMAPGEELLYKFFLWSIVRNSQHYIASHPFVFDAVLNPSLILLQ